MVNLYNYANSKTYYQTGSVYTCTKYGAYLVWQRGRGCCGDLAHLMCALVRAAGVPARYRHCQCPGFGHYWAMAYIPGSSSSYSTTGGGWVDMDLCNTWKIGSHYTITTTGYSYDLDVRMTTLTYSGGYNAGVTYCLDPWDYTKVRSGWNN